jgi:hypothetical protein
VKKLTVFLFISALLVGAVYGQGARNDPRNSGVQRLNERQRNNDPVTIEGTLKLERGYVAVESGDSVYYVPMLNQYIGFISDLREGARVSVEGRESGNVIQPTKVTIGGKSYDFPANNRGPGFGASGFNRLGNWSGRGSCCR